MASQAICLLLHLTCVVGCRIFALPLQNAQGRRELTGATRFEPAALPSKLSGNNSLTRCAFVGTNFSAIAFEMICRVTSIISRGVTVARCSSLAFTVFN